MPSVNISNKQILIVVLLSSIMKIYLIEKTEDKKLINLGGKITREKLDKEIGKGNTILIRNIEGEFQSDMRLRKVPEAHKRDRGFKKIKAFYSLNLEFGKKGFETSFPREAFNEQNFRFHSLERAIGMLELKQKLNRRDWLIEKSKT